MAKALFDALARGVLTVGRGRSFALAEAGAAHEALQSRRVTEAIVLVP